MGNTAGLVFALAVVFVFLVLAAQFESLTLPLSIILILPMCLLAAMGGVNLRGFDNNVLTQIGLVVLIALAAKNTILVVEFARQSEEQEGLSPVDAAVQAARMRLRPILMTSFAFILGAVPLALAHGAGAELRIAFGTAVCFGMLGVTGFGLLFTPTFYVVCRSLAVRQPAAPLPHAAEQGLKRMFTESFAPGPRRPRGPGRSPAGCCALSLRAGGLATALAKETPSLRLLSDDELAASLRATMAARPRGDVWVLAYGSLMWNPIIRNVEAWVAWIDGWYRSFCLSVVAGRGTVARPGLVLGLDRGGSCEGIVFGCPSLNWKRNWSCYGGGKLQRVPTFRGGSICWTRRGGCSARLSHLPLTPKAISMLGRSRRSRSRNGSPARLEAWGAAQNICFVPEAPCLPSTSRDLRLEAVAYRVADMIGKARLAPVNVGAATPGTAAPVIPAGTAPSRC